MRRYLVCLLILLTANVAASAAVAPTYRFIVTGDDRANPQPRPGIDAAGINRAELTELVAEILRVKPKFVLFNGDLVFGSTSEADFRAQLEAWLAIMKPVYQAGIHVYPVRGNHDVYAPNALKVWNEVFTGPFALPANGPEGEKDVTYSAAEENAFVVGVDQWGWHEHAVHLGWLREQLEANQLPLVLVMGHEMAFRSGHHKDNLDNNAFLRDKFIEALGRAGARVYFAGHDHLYDHLEITDPRNPNLDIHQFVVGTAGAPFYHGSDYQGDNGAWTVRPGRHIEDTYGYLLGEVEGLHVKLTFLGRRDAGVYEPMDSLAFDAGLRPGARGSDPSR